jgi:enamine deaminase RidA (YjgF/YER057c/UK114 family)
VGGLDPSWADHCNGRVRARPAVDLPQGVHNDDTTAVDRQRISSGAAFEERVGYSRAVRVGRQVWVSGTAPIMPGDADPPDEPYEQARICLEIVGRALAEAGGDLDDVVRTRIFLTRPEDIDAVGRAHRESFGAARPATTAVVTALLDPRWLVEIEAEAMIRDRAGA